MPEQSRATPPKLPLLAVGDRVAFDNISRLDAGTVTEVLSSGRVVISWDDGYDWDDDWNPDDLLRVGKRK